MKKLMVVTAAAVLASGCAPLLYPGHHYAPRARMQAAPPPVPIGRWDNVMRLPRLATIDVLTRDGMAHVGAFVGADSDRVRVLVSGEGQEIDRSDVVRVDLIDLPGSEAGAFAKGALRGALLGAGAALLIGGVIGGEAWPPPGPLVRGLAAAGGVSGGQGTLAARRGRLIYLAPNQ
jgi:hypothetical protein